MENVEQEHLTNIIDRTLIIAILVSYGCFCISTFLRNNFFILLFSPVTVTLTGVLMLFCLKRLGIYWVPSLILACGVLFYALADIIVFFDEAVTGKFAMGELIATIYLFPNYLFGTSVAVYFLQKLKRTELYQFLVNVFVFTSFGLVAFRHILIYLGSYEILTRSELLRVYLYFSINIFILIMLFNMSCMIAAGGGIKSTNIMILGIFVYIIFDIPYTYLQAIGQDPENDYTNLCYVLCMMLMASGLYFQVKKEYDFKLKGYEYSERTAKRTSIFVTVGILASLVLLCTNHIDRDEFFYIVLPMLVYWLTYSVLHNGALNEQLLKQRDILTGLYNRRYCGDIMAESVKMSYDTGKKFAVFYADLNSFKPINDSYGHDMGDRVLKEFGSRMLALPSDYVSFRTGGDEFMIVKNGVESEADLDATAVHLQRLFNTPLNLDTYIFTLSGSIGYALYPDDSKETDNLIRYADAAMYSVKHSANKDDFKRFDKGLVASVEKHKSLENRLKDADPAKDFELRYQPRIDTGTGKTVAVEVLPRLKSEEECTAYELIPIAEEVGLMNRLGKWIIETALDQQKKWRDEDGKNIAISVNLSPLQLLDKDFLTRLRKITESDGLDPSGILLEISNEAIMGASTAVRQTLWDLNKYGYHLVLNDFGGGNINLSQMQDCGFTAINLSPSLVLGEEDKKVKTLIKAIVSMAMELDIKVCAIGVESREQAEALGKMGITCLQGFYYGKPLSAEDFKNSQYF